ncbi:hypothetical protein BDZ45DRAFT_804537 [Acephala macrosclerotiorum]|nr:hypothetical protein BDZ45DRAFT_804537 [Acephala macrosclerotiorum]
MTWIVFRQQQLVKLRNSRIATPQTFKINNLKMNAPSRLPRPTMSLRRRPTKNLRRMPAMESRPQSTVPDGSIRTYAYGEGFRNVPPAKTTPPPAPAPAPEDEDRSASAFFQSLPSTTAVSKAQDFPEARPFGSIATQTTRQDFVFDKTRTKSSTGGSTPPTPPSTTKRAGSEPVIRPGSVKVENSESPTTPGTIIHSRLEDRPISLLENISHKVSYRDSTAPSISAHEPFPAFRNSVMAPKRLSEPSTSNTFHRHSGFLDFGNPFSEAESISTISNCDQVSPFEDIEVFPTLEQEPEEKASRQVPQKTPNSFVEPDFKSSFPPHQSSLPTPDPDCVLNLAQKLIKNLKRGIEKTQNLDRHLENWTWNRNRKRMERRRLSQKRRESSARAKSIDDSHRQKIQVHKEKEKARNKRAVQQLKKSEKVMKVQSKNRDRAASRGNGADRGWFGRGVDWVRFRRKKGVAILPAKKRAFERVQKGRKGRKQGVDKQQPVLRREGASLVTESVKEVETDEERFMRGLSWVERGGHVIAALLGLGSGFSTWPSGLENGRCGFMNVTGRIGL